MRRSLLLLTLVLLTAAPAHAWQPAEELSTPGAEATAPVMAALADGTLVTAWTEAGQVRARVAPAAGAPGEILELGAGVRPAVAAAGGHALVAWTDGAQRTRVADPRAPAVVADLGPGSGGVAVAVAADGRAAAFWDAAAGLVGSVRAMGVWGAAQPVGAAAAGDWPGPQIAATVAGDAVVGWRAYDGMHVGGLDGSGMPLQERVLSAGRITEPRLDGDAAGNVVAAWVEPGEIPAPGVVKLARRRGGSWDLPQTMPGQVHDAFRPLDLDVAPAGPFLLAYAVRAADGQYGPTRVLQGTAGATELPGHEDIPGSGIWQLAAVADDGTAVVAADLSGMTTRRRAPGGSWVTKAVSCPVRASELMDATADSVLWLQRSPLLATRGLRLSRGPTGGPEACPDEQRGLRLSAQFVRPGEPVTIDASGMLDPEAAAGRFSFDLDGDEGYEIVDSPEPKVTHVFAGSGWHRGFAMVDNLGADGYPSTGSGSPFGVYVYTPEELAAMDRLEGGKLAPRKVAPALVVRPQRMRTTLARGVAVAVATSGAGKVALRLELARPVAKKLRLPVVVGRKRVVSGPAGSTLRVPFTAKARRALKRRRSVAVTVVAVAGGLSTRQLAKLR